MRKTITKIICIATAAISAAGLMLTAGCGNWKYEGVSKDNYTSVTSNGGFVVQTDDYVYFVNGAASNTDDNTFGNPLKGSLQRISKADLAAHNYSSSSTVVPLVLFSGYYEAGVYIYGDRVYYSTPSTAKNSSGEIQNSNLEFKSSTLDGKETMSDYYYRSSSTALEYRYVEVDDTVYLMYVVSEALYGETSAVTNIHSINTSTREDVLIAYNVSDYAFDTEDPENPYVFYTMKVTYNLGSLNSISESYNQLFVARADAKQSAADYDFSYVEDYDASEDPLYVNKGEFVLDGIGFQAYGERYCQFNYGFGSDKSYSINYADVTYSLSQFKNGTLFFVAKQSLDTTGGLYAIDCTDFDADEDGQVDKSWDAISANEKIKTDYRLLTTSDGVDYTFVTIDGQQKVLYNGDGGLMIGRFENGGIKDEYSLTDSGEATIIAIRDETSASETGSGTETHTNVYYSLTGGNGYTIYRIAIDGDKDDYATNRLPSDDLYTYSEVRILDLDAKSSWYLPEFVENQILFASETEGMSGYNYIMAFDLNTDDGVMSNAEINALNEQFEGITEKIEEYSEKTNSDGTEAYRYLPDALKYLFRTGDAGYLDDLIQAYVDIEGKDKEYLYSERSAEIYREFATAAENSDWAEYREQSRKVNGETVYSNSIEYYYSVVGRMTGDDYQGYLDDLRTSYMQSYPVDDSTWWDNLSTVAKVFFIIGMCVAGLLVIGGITVLVIFLVRRHKRKKLNAPSSRKNVDITDDKNIDVYNN